MSNQDSPSYGCAPSYEYKFPDDKRVYIVSPVYREDTDKTIHDALLNLMLKHA